MANIILFTFQIMAWLNIYSLNANGMRNLDKVKNIFGILSNWNSDICLLQETYWDEELVNDIEPLWDGVIFYSNNTKHNCGVAILVSKRIKHSVSLVSKDNSGRIIKIKYEDEENEFDILNIYAPNNSIDKSTFL